MTELPTQSNRRSARARSPGTQRSDRVRVRCQVGRRERYPAPQWCRTRAAYAARVSDGVPHGDDSDLIPGLNAEAAHRLSASWDDGGLWNDICWLAERFLASDESNARAVAWHHLVLAIGNFKRPTGRRLRPAHLSPRPSGSSSERAPTLLVPGLDRPVMVTDIATWRCLAESIPGAGVATTTTLLSALWPGDHIVFDWRVHAAANALRIGAAMEPTPGVTPESTVGATETFEDYRLVRKWVVKTAMRVGAKPVDIERALYRLSQGVPDEPGRTWMQYATAVAERLGPAAQ